MSEVEENEQIESTEPSEPTQAERPDPEFRSGYCAIVGVPNAGKSTLLNALLGTKLSIMTHKPQTTRKRVLGIYSSAREQIIFLDTPGIMPRPTTLLHKAMLDEVRKSFSDADVILVLVEANQPFDRALPQAWQSYKKIAGDKPIVLAVSKSDLLKDRTELFPILQHYGESQDFKELIPISSTKRYNLGELTRVLHSHLPNTTRFYDEDQLSDQNERFFVTELIRESVFLTYKEEIPYSTEVEVREFKERENGKWFISADVIVERESQRSIVIGKQGSALKAVGSRARKEIEQFLGQPVYLELHVKTRADWRNNKRTLSDFGYSV